METSLDLRDIAGRVQQLLGSEAIASRVLTVQRVGLPFFAPGAPIDVLAPLLSMDALAAIVREYGVDPSWMLFGQYDRASHRAALGMGLSFSTTDLMGVVTGRVPSRICADPAPITTAGRAD